MLNQSWIHNNVYIKPLQFPASESTRTFYFTAKGSTGNHYGLLGELVKLQDEDDDDDEDDFDNTTNILKSVNTFLNEATTECLEDATVFEALCKKLDDTYDALSMTFQLWTHQMGAPTVTIISMGLQMVRFVTKEYKDVKLPNNSKAYESRKVKKYVRDEVRLDQTQFMILATNGFPQPSYFNRPDSIFELTRQLTDLFVYKAHKNPNESKDACVLLMDFCKFHQTHEFVRYGFKDLDAQIDEILKVIPTNHDHFAAKLVMSELLLNAFKKGNAIEADLPIKIIVGVNDDEMVIEVFDMTLMNGTLSAKSTLDHEYLLGEYGRGLFLANTFSNDVYIDNNSIASRIKTK
jgi:anti-sigma regulatory factor (Ser/Thr protein kinase)